MLHAKKDLVPDKKKKMSFKKILSGVILGFLLGQGLVFLVHKVWIFPYTVANDFMEPTLKKGSSIYINRLANPADFQRGDLVFARHPENPDLYMIRRVIALPGDRIEIQNRNVIINGSALKDKIEISIQNYWNGISPVKYTEFSDNESMKDVKIKENEIFLMGDNRRTALDSRHFGPVSFDFISGKIKVQ